MCRRLVGSVLRSCCMGDLWLGCTFFPCQFSILNLEFEEALDWVGLDWKVKIHTRCFLRRHSVQEVKVRWRGRIPDCILSVLRIYFSNLKYEVKVRGVEAV